LPRRAYARLAMTVSIRLLRRARNDSTLSHHRHARSGIESYS
jgi:hypothetical protein